jgi:hypothetical protein
LAIQLARDFRDVPLVTLEQRLDLGLFRPGARRPAARSSPRVTTGKTAGDD